MSAIPFQFALTNTDIYGVLWNPTGATVPTSVGNTELTDLNSDAILDAGLVVPAGRFVLTSATVEILDAASSLAFGYYDTVAAAFVELLVVVGPLVDAAPVTFDLGGGLVFPAGATKVPCVKYLTGDNAYTVHGFVAVSPLSEAASTAASGTITAPTQDLLDEDAGYILAEGGERIQDG